MCWVRENFSGGLGHIFSVWDSAVWSAGPVQVYWGTFLEWMAGLYRFFFSGSVVAGTVQLKWWGVVPSFFSLSSVCCQLSWRAVVCGRILFFYICFPWLSSGTICGFVFYKLLIYYYLLQMVEEEFGPGRL